MGAIVVAALLATVFGLLPLGVYFNWVAGVHRRPQPVVLSGIADLALVLAGLVGFLPTLLIVALFALQSNARLLARGSGQLNAELWAEERLAWLLTAVLFFVIVAGVVGQALLARRGTLAVYNVGRLALEQAVHDVLTGLGLTAARFGNVWGDGREILSVDPVPGFGYATIRFRTGDPRLREELDRNLRLRLDQTPGANGGCAGLFTMVGMGCLGGAVAAVALLVYFSVIRP